MISWDDQSGAVDNGKGRKHSAKNSRAPALLLQRGEIQNHVVTRALANARIKDTRKAYVTTNGSDKAKSPGNLKRTHFIVKITQARENNRGIKKELAVLKTFEFT